MYWQNLMELYSVGHSLRAASNYITNGTVDMFGIPLGPVLIPGLKFQSRIPQFKFHSQSIHLGMEGMKTELGNDGNENPFLVSECGLNEYGHALMNYQYSMDMA